MNFLNKYCCSAFVLLGLLLLVFPAFAQSNLPTPKKLFLVGMISPIKQVKIQPGVSGKIREIYVEENEAVRAGELLLTLDNDVQQQQMEIAQVQLDLSKNALQESDASLKDAQQRYNEEQALHKQGASSQSLLTQSKLKLKQVQLAYDRAKLNVALAEKEVSVRGTAYQNTLIHSPIEGVITRKHVEAGEFVGASSLSFEVANLHRIRIESTVSENEVALIHPGQQTSFTTPAYPGKVFYGKVERVAWSSDAQNRRFPVYITSQNTELLLKGGMTANIELSLLAPAR